MNNYKTIYRSVYVISESFWHPVQQQEEPNHTLCLIQPDGDYDEPRILGSLIDEVGHNGNILEVQGSTNLVHHIQRCWLE